MPFFRKKELADDEFKWGTKRERTHFDRNTGRATQLVEMPPGKVQRMHPEAQKEFKVMPRGRSLYNEVTDEYHEKFPERTSRIDEMFSKRKQTKAELKRHYEAGFKHERFRIEQMKGGKAARRRYGGPPPMVPIRMNPYTPPKSFEYKPVGSTKKGSKKKKTNPYKSDLSDFKFF